jgi:xylulokinase
MAAEYFLGIDLGTSSCKVCLMDSDYRLKLRESSEYPTSLPKEGWTEQDPFDWIEALALAVKSSLSKAAIRANEVAGISLSSAAHIGVLLDANNIPLRKAILWNDQRSYREVEHLLEQNGTTIFEKTYNQVSTTWTLPHLLWIKNNEPDKWEKTKRILLSKDYVVFWLTESIATDHATALSSLLLNAQSGHWSEELCGLIGIDASYLPEVISASEVAGRLTREAAEKIGLIAGTPVVTGTLDSAAEMFCAGAVRSGSRLVRLATAGGIQVVWQEPRPHKGVLTYPHPVSPLWYSQAGTNSCGSSIEWSLKTLGGKVLTYEQFNRLANEAPIGSGDVIFHPYLAGERSPYWDSSLRGSFVGLSLSHGLEHMARSVVEGVCFSIRDAYQALSSQGMKEEGSLLVAGGGTKSQVWTRILCDIMDRNLKIVRDVDSSYGVAMLGLAALRGVSDLSSLRGQLDLFEEEMDPNPKSSQKYEVQFEKYGFIQRQLARVYHRYRPG